MNKIAGVDGEAGFDGDLARPVLSSLVSDRLVRSVYQTDGQYPAQPTSRRLCSQKNLQLTGATRWDEDCSTLFHVYLDRRSQHD